MSSIGLDNKKLATLTAAIGLSGAAIFYSLYTKPKHKFPPGPPRDPIIGNVRNFPLTDWYPNFTKFHDKYGEIVYVNVLGQPIVILGSIEAVEEILNKRANIHSGRPANFMLTEIMGWNWVGSLRQPDAIHGDFRKIIRTGIGPQQVSKYFPLIESETKKFLHHLKTYNGDVMHALTDFTGGIVIQITYGKQLWSQHGKELVSLNVEAMTALVDAMVQIWPVNFFHFLRFIPSWFPGAIFKRVGARSQYLTSRIRHWPFNFTLDLHRSSGSNNSLVSALVDSEYGNKLDLIRDTTAIVYTAGVDTTASVINNFLFAMVLFPHVAKRVRQEIDGLTDGGKRLPKVVDRFKLPYTEAAWKESIRWHPSAPLGGLVHMSSKEDIWRGYCIPQGTTIIANIGYMLRDPKIWNKPGEFIPERWLGEEAQRLPNPIDLHFGFGLRKCPGRFLAEAAGFHSAACILSVFDLVPPADSIYTLTNLEYVEAAIRVPNNFRLTFIPRSKHAEDLLKL